MTFIVRIKAGEKNAFTGDGSSYFQTSTLERHAKSVDHRRVTTDLKTDNSLHQMMLAQLSESDQAIVSALWTVYFLAKQDIASHKYQVHHLPRHSRM